ncbi:DUF1642 domain-containing protein [Lactococcus garvieae]|uniref:DUF1642 domain-containing protein n=1 Tax=Lactococcus garvieae TaxID=1363 RepID=UPI0030CE3AEA
MKKFEEEMKEWFGSPTGFNMEFQSGYEAYSALVKRFKGYISPEDHQAEIDKLKSQLEKQLPEIPEFVAEYIKSTADPIHEMCAWSEHYGDNGTKCDDLDLAKMLDWFGTNREIFYKAVVNDYTVEKPKRFHLKNKLTGLYLRSYSGLSMDDTSLRFEEVSDNRACGFGGGTQFTQSEIDNMETGSYEQIEVEE